MDAVWVRIIGGHTLVDAQDAGLVLRYPWRLAGGYVGMSLLGRPVMLHRLLIGTPPHLQTDHINRDRSDNRRVNLRWATASQNAANRPKTLLPHHRSIYKGVGFDPRHGVWTIHVTCDYETRPVGRYETEEEAARAYDAAAGEAFGEFAVLNFPE